MLTESLTLLLSLALYAVLTALLWRLLSERKIVITLVAALILNTGLTVTTQLGSTPLMLQQYQTSIVLFGYLAWTLAILWIALKIQVHSAIFQGTFWAVWLLATATVLTESIGLRFAEWFSNTIGVVFAFVTLYAFERVIRSDRVSADERTIVITMGSLVALDIFYLSLKIADLQAAQWIDQARPYVYLMVCCVLAGWAFHRLSSGKIRLSYQASQGGWSLLTLALVVSVMITSSTLIQNNNSQVTNVLLAAVIIGLLLLVFAGAVSPVARNHLRVVLNKHFFSQRFDYRSEWLGVSRALGETQRQADAEKTALDVLVSTTDSQAGALWLKSDGAYRLAVDTLDFCDASRQLKVFDDHPMIERMHSDAWIYAVKSPLDTAAGQYNDDLPEHINGLANFWLILPLILHEEVIGFAGLTSPHKSPQFDYESLDIARLTSFQVAGFLQLHRYERQQEDQARFAVYSQMSSFLMHDLNNVLHQQKLLLKNAQRHRDNPEFMDDMLETIDNSVNRLETLVGRLGTGKPEKRQLANLGSVVETALNLYANKTSEPTLDIVGPMPNIACDQDKLAMAIGHIVKNAQDASGNGHVQLTADTQAAYARVRIQDSGGGMTDEFIQEKLFKPFESTKDSGGMGIGVYLTKTYIEQLGGRIQVESEPGQGTLFSLFLPIQSGAQHA